jgi:hypothetical protein
MESYGCVCNACDWNYIYNVATICQYDSLYSSVVLSKWQNKQIQYQAQLTSTSFPTHQEFYRFPQSCHPEASVVLEESLDLDL